MTKLSLHTFGLIALLVAWAVAHSVGVTWGASHVPLHANYVSDEQRPVNGALHILNERSIFGIRGKEEFIYGPILAMFTVPAVVADFAWRAITEGVRTASAYRDIVIFDWGGIIVWMRLLVVAGGVVALYLLYRMFLLTTLNPRSYPPYALAATGLMAVNYFFFNNTNFFINWTWVAYLLIAELYLGLLIYESHGRKQLFWWLHGIVTVCNFGINYLNVVYLVAFAPLALQLWIQKEHMVRRTLLWYVLLVSLGLVFIVWWNPLTFWRIVGIGGVGSMAGTMGVEYADTYKPFLSATSSYAYYLRVLLVNHVPLVVTLLLVVPFLARKFRDNFMWMWMFGSVALINFIIFGSIAHYEERYLLITIVTCVLFVGAAVVRYCDYAERRRTILVGLATLLAGYVVFHGAHVVRWMVVYADGPAEQRMIDEALALEREGGSLALVQPHIAGHAHTKEAYQKFTEQKNAKDVNLYKAIMAAPLPHDVVPLNATYIMPWDYEKDAALIDGYTHAIKYVQGCSPEIDRATFIGENILVLWDWDECRPRYERIK